MITTGPISFRGDLGYNIHDEQTLKFIVKVDDRKDLVVVLIIVTDPLITPSSRIEITGQTCLGYGFQLSISTRGQGNIAGITSQVPIRPK